MDFTISAAGAQHAHLRKFVLTIFLREPRDSKCEIFAEICSQDTEKFILTAPEKPKIVSVPELYLDEVACEKIFSGYEPSNKGAHKQSVDGDVLHIQPVAANIHEVNSPKDAHGDSTLITLDLPDDTSLCAGTWLRWQQDLPSIETNPNFENFVSIQANNIDVDNIHVFLVLPAGYKSISGDYEILQKSTALHDNELINRDLVYESDLGAGFPIFIEWRNKFYGKRFLRNRRSIWLRRGQCCYVKFRLFSETAHVSRIFKSYFFGLFFSFFSGLLASGLMTILTFYFWRQQDGSDTFFWIFMSVFFVATISAGVLGWRAVLSKSFKP